MEQEDVSSVVLVLDQRREWRESFPVVPYYSKYNQWLFSSPPPFFLSSRTKRTRATLVESTWFVLEKRKESEESEESESQREPKRVKESERRESRRSNERETSRGRQRNFQPTREEWTSVRTGKRVSHMTEVMWTSKYWQGHLTSHHHINIPSLM